MQYPNPKIKFYKVRTFGEKFNTTFDFLRETWRPLFKFTAYLILPICLVQAFAMNSVMNFAFMSGAGEIDTATSFVGKMLLDYGLLLVCTLIGSALLAALSYTLMQQYDRREQRLHGITLAEMKQPLWHNMLKMIKASALTLGMMLLIGGVVSGLVFLSPWTLIITLPLLLVGLLVSISPLSLFTPIYIYEEIGLIAALRKAFRYGLPAWGETFLVILVLGLIGNLIGTVTMMPWYIMILAQGVLTLANEAQHIVQSWWYEFILYLLSIIQSYGTYISTIISTVGLGFQYFHLREKREGVTVNENIANFDRL